MEQEDEPMGERAVSPFTNEEITASDQAMADVVKRIVDAHQLAHARLMLESLCIKSSEEKQKEDSDNLSNH